ncbi:endonuclease/exonuclease/phosphatase family protein [Chitinivorax sp. B]|uniref:endonuclease/exonuclease/phosphatase family protein n=1 Tax=Chitinivorax sp. B TaxID=2502235 RepID=UPI00148513E9|nr:endonuclease/exonuclease/phosphatase family protein [Chitinivorax sp. B]
MKLLTWNTLGERWNAMTDRIDQYQPDVVCIQEAGNLPKELGYTGELTQEKPYMIGTYSGYSIWYLWWDRQGGTGNIRCSMAMLFKGSGGPSVSWSTDSDKRPIMRASIGASYYVANIHAGGREYINQAIQSVLTNGYGKTWVVAGDFNQEADGDLSWMDRRARVIAPDEATRPASHKIIDYAVSNGTGKASVAGPYYGGSDHRCVVINIS